MTCVALQHVQLLGLSTHNTHVRPWTGTLSSSEDFLLAARNLRALVTTAKSMNCRQQSKQG
jgi:hypothetical protein